MKLLVFATTPPPVHGQNLMVATLLAGLKADPEFEVLHVDPRLSRTAQEIGRLQIRKSANLLLACARAIRLRLKHGPMAFYYVPAPGKRSALYRDWVVMLLCRLFFSRLILHWHAVGLGGWLAARSRWLERSVTRFLLGRASLAIVLDPAVADDAARLNPRQIVVVANGIQDPTPAFAPRIRSNHAPLHCLYLGLCSAEKGLFDLVEAIAAVNAGQAEPVAVLSVAGSFPDAATGLQFGRRAAALGAAVRHLGPLSGKAKAALFQAADVFCLPTRYPHEGQPLVLLEALAYDLPIIASRWRAIPGMLPDAGVWLIRPGAQTELAEALREAASTTPAPGPRRLHYLEHYRLDIHMRRMRQVLLDLAPF